MGTRMSCLVDGEQEKPRGLLRRLSEKRGLVPLGPAE